MLFAEARKRLSGGMFACKSLRAQGCASSSEQGCCKASFTCKYVRSQLHRFSE